MPKIAPARNESFLEELEHSITELTPYTMISHGALVHLGILTNQVLSQGLPGDLVECGVWRGGASFLMAQILRSQASEKKVWMFDSFQGLPEPTDLDGPQALQYAQSSGSAAYLDNCKADLKEVQDTCESLGLSSVCKIEPGWFEDTLAAAKVDQIALLRIDGDWYSSTKVCLELLYDKVVEGGFVVFDDYYTWDGCTRAVNEFLADKSERLEQYGTIAYFQKGTHFLEYSPDGFTSKRSLLDDFKVALAEAEGARIRNADLSRLSKAYDQLNSELLAANKLNTELSRDLYKHQRLYEDLQRSPLAVSLEASAQLRLEMASLRSENDRLTSSDASMRLHVARLMDELASRKTTIETQLSAYNSLVGQSIQLQHELIETKAEAEQATVGLVQEVQRLTQELSFTRGTLSAANRQLNEELKRLNRPWTQKLLRRNGT